MKTALICLALNIYHEARGQSIAGQLAVAEVTLNRVEHKSFPDTVCKVVMQGEKDNYGNMEKGRCQFSWYCDTYSDKPHETTAWLEALDLARIMLDKDRSISVVGKEATHYHATSVTPYWADDMERLKKVGDHIFYKK